RVVAVEEAVREGLAALASRMAESEGAYFQAGDSLRRSIEHLGSAIRGADAYRAPSIDQVEAAPAATSFLAFAPTPEGYRPEELDGYLADSDLVGGHYDQRLCRSVDGFAALDCYANADAAHAQPPAMYGSVLRRGKRIALEYWLFYPFDLYSPTDPPADIWQ